MRSTAKVSLLAYVEERVGTARLKRAVFDLSLFGQVFGRLDGCTHPHRGQVGCQVGRVGADDDEGEEPPHARHYTS